MKLSDGLPIVHGVEGGNLVNAHGRDLEDTGHFIHDADGGVAELTLAEVEEGHHGRFFILRRIAFEDLGDECFILCSELERDRGVVFGRVAVL